jgi:hypothetical protein
MPAPQSNQEAISCKNFIHPWAKVRFEVIGLNFHHAGKD